MPPCASCGKNCTTACGRCHSVYFCGRGCQEKAWPEHKRSCVKAKLVEVSFAAATVAGIANCMVGCATGCMLGSHCNQPACSLHSMTSHMMVLHKLCPCMPCTRHAKSCRNAEILAWLHH